VLEYIKFPDHLTDEEMRHAEAEVKYEGYLRRQEKEVERIKRMDKLKVPESTDFNRIPGLTREAVENLLKSRPRTIGQAKEIPGMTAAAVVNLSLYVQAQKKRPKAGQRST
jgi:tRNA uridine 5-carboxymethylaminomethyl modification enzyme